MESVVIRSSEINKTTKLDFEFSSVFVFWLIEKAVKVNDYKMKTS